MHDLISLYVPADASNAYLSLVGDHDVLSIAPKGQQKPLSIFVRMHAPNKKGCLPFVIYSEGDAQLEGVEADVFGENSRIDETPIESGAAKLIRSKACYDDIRDTFIAEMGVNRLHGNISFTGHSSTIYRLPDLAAQGTKIASKEMLRTPLDSTLFDDMLTGVYSRKIRVGCDVDLGPMAIVERLDVARPELSKSYADPSDPEVPSGDRIYWDKCLMGGKTAVVSDIQMEQDASTKVFVAGALIGVSVSLLSFAIELFFEAFRHRAE
ncbi:hypothetical protein [Nonomuraea jabiensis]|uniref:hypothetical protein n=1 Tax=Nonomuraea jabiensis TaxID=882448 RepID=UPI003D708FFE